MTSVIGVDVAVIINIGRCSRSVVGSVVVGCLSLAWYLTMRSKEVSDLRT